MLDIVERTKLTEGQINTAIIDYFKHLWAGDALNVDDFSDGFVMKLAEDAVKAKAQLRELFSKSQYWNDEMSMLEVPVIVSGAIRNRYEVLFPLFEKIFEPLLICGFRKSSDEQLITSQMCDRERDCANCVVRNSYAWSDVSYSVAWSVASLIADLLEANLKTVDRTLLKNKASSCQAEALEILDMLFPNAFAEGRKLSRVVQMVAQAAGVADTSKGSEYQKAFAAVSDIINAKPKPETLYISLNPAHFLTMSNPKNDKRGIMMTSCHSLNCTEYPYNAGCTGYARDPYTFIVFTADPSKPETLNNRKTSRQVFMWGLKKPFLLQSRMYNATGASDATLFKTYRETVQNIIHDCLGKDEKWTWTQVKYANQTAFRAHSGSEFGGYDDWAYPNYGATVSTMVNAEEDASMDWHTHVGSINIGKAGLCIECGGHTEEGLRCGDCRPENECMSCGEYCDTDHMEWVDSENGYVCEACLENYYVRCDHCGEVLATNSEHLYWVDDAPLCSDCFNELAFYCYGHERNEWRDETTVVEYHTGWGTQEVCEEWAEESGEFGVCDTCGNLVQACDLTSYYDASNDCTKYFCENCEYDVEHFHCEVLGEEVIEGTLSVHDCKMCSYRDDCEECLYEGDDEEEIA